jgi:hypothetical protein
VRPVYWWWAQLRPVENWDRLTFSECEALVRGLYRLCREQGIVATGPPG